MNCETVHEMLDDYLDGLLTLQNRRAVDAHFSKCARCRDDERALRLLTEDARALPKEVLPGRDLWPELAARLDARRAWWRRVVPFAGRERIFTLRRWAVAGALAAAVLVAAAFMLVRPRERGDALYHRAATRESDVLPAAGRSQDFALADAEYVAAAGNLLSALEERKGALPPGSITVIQENLRSIQTALEQIRKALEKDPGNRDLNTLLMATYRKEVDLLQQAARLSDSM